jgi:citrate synthase
VTSRRYLTAEEASRELAISQATLYAYVSRGLVRSEAVPGDQRARRYRAEDVQRLKQRKERQRNPAAAVEQALHWGTPVLDSALTLIADGRLYYRGHDALELAATHRIEEVAALLWTGGVGEAASFFDAPPLPFSRRCQTIHRQLASLPTVEVFQALLPVASSEDLAAFDLRPAAVARTGARMLRFLVRIATGNFQGAVDLGIAEALQQSWVPANSRASGLLNTALILCADHELNVSSFTARCVASAGSTPYAAVIAGLSALQGFKHGRQTERVETLLRRARGAAGVRGTLAGYLKRGERIPGFGQPLYPEGDPRGAELLRLVRETLPESPWVALASAVVQEAAGLIGAHPTIDFGLATVARALELPTDGAMTVFALGRTIGWIGHAIEEYRADRLIRPRARYVGEQPAEAAEDPEPEPGDLAN